MARDKNFQGLGTVFGILASLATIAGYVQRTTCSCCGTSLPLFGDTDLFGKRYCKNCGHYH